MSQISSSLKTLIIGYGNPGRLDDGLGPCFIEAFPDKNNKNIDLQSNYQLTVEDALTITHYEQVIFVDASINCQAPFCVEEILTTNDTGFGSHSLSPQALIQLCHTLYQHHPKAYILAIRGYKFDQFKEQLSDIANKNLTHALNYLAAQLHA